MAGGGKETPRQKMIGMMYLVLTALLAMNISKNVLDAFVIVNQGLERTNLNFNNSTVKMMAAFKESTKSTPQAGPYYAKAVVAEKMLDDTYDYIDSLKHALISFVEAKPGSDTLKLKYVDQKDNYDKPTELMIGSDETNPKKGRFSAVELKGKLVGVHDKLLKMLEDMQKKKETQFLKDDYDNLKKKIETLLPEEGETENGVPVTWELHNFDHMVLAGIICSLSKMQADLNNVESEIVSNFSGAAGRIMVKFDKLSAKVIAPSSYVQAGTKYKAEIFIAAGSSDFKAENMQVIVNPTSYDTTKGEVVGGTPMPIVNGMGEYEIGTSGQGEQKYKGIIRFKKPDGSFDLYPFDASYMVAAPSVAVSADMMNVFYVGVPNPVTISAAGVSPTDLIVSPSGGGVRSTPKGAGKYEFTFTSPGECNVSVSSKSPGGPAKNQGSQKFRVKPLPSPIATVGGVTGAVDMKKTSLASIGGVGAMAPNFDFKANFIVLGFTITGSVRGQTKVANCQGNGLNADARSILAGAGIGSKIFIDELIIKGPDGKITKNAPGITIKVKGG
ncbi:MAG: type IX secretion system motor protein PorM/GldM [Bacteroidia bacterium]